MFDDIFRDLTQNIQKEQKKQGNMKQRDSKEGEPTNKISQDCWHEVSCPPTN